MPDDAQPKIDHELSEALCRFLARSDQGVPKRDRAAVALLVGADRADEVIARLDRMLEEVIAAEFPLPGGAGVRTESAKRRLAAAHPELSPSAVEAAGWDFWHTFYW